MEKRVHGRGFVLGGSRKKVIDFYATRFVA